MNYIPGFKKVFPELKNISSEELCDRWQELGIEFYSKEQAVVNLWFRFTLPFAIILFILMFITLPIKFLITGTWSYNLSEKNIILNWFRSLQIYK